MNRLTSDGRSQTIGTAVPVEMKIADLVEIAIEQWPHELLASRVWEQRDNLSSYDASYVALAEQLDFPLVTEDGAILEVAPDVAITPGDVPTER